MISTKLYFGKLSTVALSFLFFGLVAPNEARSCMTASGIAHNGHVWTANNEDGPFGVANFINVFPRSGTDRYGYYTMTYISPRYALTGAIQGGMNEAGLSFDFDAIPFVEGSDRNSKKPYPQGNNGILPHILGNMETVQEVIAFFETYWFVDGFNDAQMHVSDKNGRFAIISASGIKLIEAGEFLVSTNFDISGNGDGSTCWRYPIAVDRLSTLGAGLKTMESICRETAQKTGGTMYSNIQNLTTGDIWFFSNHDPGIILRTNIAQMLSNGPRSYTFSDLGSLKENRPVRRWQAPEKVEFSQNSVQDYIGIYEHFYIGTVEVLALEHGIEVSFVDGTREILYLDKQGNFSLPDFDLYVKFGTDKNSGRPQLSLYENGLWSFTVQKPEDDQQNTVTKK